MKCERFIACEYNFCHSRSHRIKRTCFELSSLLHIFSSFFLHYRFFNSRFMHAHAIILRPPARMSQRKYLLLLDIHKFSLQIGCCKYCTIQDIYKYFFVFFALLHGSKRKKMENVEQWHRSELLKDVFLTICEILRGGNQEINVAKGVALEKGIRYRCHIHRKFPMLRRKFMFTNSLRRKKLNRFVESFKVYFLIEVFFY